MKVALRIVGLILIGLCGGVEPLFASADSGEVRLGDDPHVLLNAVETLLKRKDYDMAETVIEAALKKENLPPNIDASLTLHRAQIELDKDRPARAIVWLTRWLEYFSSYPNAPHVTFILAQTYRQIGALDRARENFYRTLTFALARASGSKDKDYINRLYDLGRLTKWELAETEYLAGQWLRALDLFERFIDQNVESDVLVESALYRQADCKSQLRQIQPAISAYRAALAVAPFHPFAPEAWLRLIVMDAQEKNYSEQRKSIESFIWLVSNVRKENTVYWQQRCMKALADSMKDDPKGLSELVAIMPASTEDPGWAAIRTHLFQLLSRHQGSPASVAGDDVQQTREKDPWFNWKDDFDSRSEKLIKQTDDFLKRTKKNHSP